MKRFLTIFVAVAILAGFSGNALATEKENKMLRKKADVFYRTDKVYMGRGFWVPRFIWEEIKRSGKLAGPFGKTKRGVEK